MWRYSFEEDWERKKEYLIRSLFRDIPALSPVPEEQESRYSPINDGPRPHSPLPPLIIERMPNRHDHPEQFYHELEHKMKKLFRRLFYEESCSSVEDLIEAYAGDAEVAEVASFSDHWENIRNDPLDTTYVVNAVADRKRRSIPLIEFNSASERPSSEEDEGDIESNVSSASQDMSLTDGRPSHCVESSSQSLHATQVTIEADVHDELAQRQTDDNLLEVDTYVLSPILPRREPENVLSRSDGDKEESVSERQIIIDENKSETMPDTKRDGNTSAKELSEVNVTGESVEQMRRQRQTSPSLGSLPEEHNIGSPSSGHSMTYTDIDFLTKMSLEQCDLKSITPPDERKISQSKETVLNDLTSFTTSESYEECRRKFSDEVRKRGTTSSQESSDIVTKRKKFENIAIQTSVSSDSENVNWNQLKSNFFVGIPKIYKLCCCNDHYCKSFC